MPESAAPVIWNEIKIEYAGPLSLDYALDGKNRNAIVKLTNVGDSLIEDIYFQIAIEGVGDYPATTGDGGFAVFPNGGNVDLAPGESYYVQNWLQGVYETRYENSPPNSGETKIYSFDFLISFDLDVWRTENPTASNLLAGKLTQQISFTNTSSDSLPAGSQQITGAIANSSESLTNLSVEISTPYSKWYQIETTSSDGYPRFSVTVPERDDWLIRFTADGKGSQTISATDLLATDFINLEDSSALDFGYSVNVGISAPTGFWRGAASEPDESFVLFPGQENWLDLGDSSANAALRATSVIQKYSFTGELLWQYEPGWETWGGDMSEDGSKVVFLLNPDITRYDAGQWTLGVLDGQSGQLIWSFTGDRTTGPYLEGLEAAVSPDGQYVAAGSTNGALGVFDANTGALLWQKESGTFGQIRKLVFSGEHLYVGSGDGFLNKLSDYDGTEVWKSYIGGWPFVMGLSINNAAGLIAVGTKSKDTSVLDADTGEVLWLKQTGSLDAVLSPDGKYVSNFYGDIFDSRTGVLVGQTGVQGAVLFTSDSQFLIQADRGRVSISDLSGKLLSEINDTSDEEYGSGEQSQWAYLTADGATLLVASRDMDTPGERGITFWKIGDPLVAEVIDSESSGGSQNADKDTQAGPNQVTSGDDTLDLPGEDTTIDAGSGIDTVVYKLNSNSFDIERIAETLSVTDTLFGWSHTLAGIERVQFADTKLAFDIEGHAGEAAKTLGAFLGKDGIQRADLVRQILDLLDGGLSYDGLLQAALDAVVGTDPSSALLINHFHEALTGKPASSEIIDTYSTLLDNGSLSNLDFAKQVADSDINQQNIDLVGLATTGLEYF